MKYNPDVHHRRSIRLKHYDYSRNGAYFVTLCTFDRGCYFARFPQLRDIVDGQWNMIPERFPNVELDEYVIMPNHFHRIVVIQDIRRDTPCGYPDPSGYPSPTRVSLGDIVGAYKSLCVSAWLKVIKTEDINTRGKFSSPVMRTGTCFHSHLARWQLGEEHSNLVTSQDALFYFLGMFIETHSVKNTFCQIKANGGNLHGGLLSLQIDGIRNHYHGT